MRSSQDNRQSDHLVLWSDRSRTVSQGGHPFFERNWWAGWLNFLLQEVGPHVFSSLEHFDFETLDLYRFVYLSSSLAGKLKGRYRAPFESYVQAGGTLVVEGLTANSLESPGIRFSLNPKPLKSITSVLTPAVPPPLVESLFRMPFWTLGWEVESRKTDLEVIVEMGGEPVFFKRSVGRGTVFTLGFDFGLLLTGLQQGVPVKGARRLQKLFGTQSRVIEPEDLVLQATLLDNTVPWADLFERFFFKVITQDEVVPRWWYFPHTYTGAVISTHDDEAIGADPRLEAMCQQEKSEGIRATLFVISDPELHERWSGNVSPKPLSQAGSEIGLHWNRFEKPRFKVRSHKFGMHEEPLGQQIEYLRKELGQPIRLNRTHYLALGKTYDEHFKSLSAQGIFFDSTYGPNQGGRGYLFGTGYPYQGLTWKGSPTGVFELPFLTQELWGGADLPFLEQLIRESDENFHQVITMNFHPHYTILQEEGRAVWLGSLRFAKERKQWIPTLGEFFEFFKARNESPLRSRFKEGKGETWVDARQEGAVLSFPLYHAGKKLLHATLDGTKIETGQVVNSWFQEALIPVPQGTHQIEVLYEG